MSEFERKSSMENYRRKSALKVARRNATKYKDTLKASLNLWGLGNRLYRSDQSGEVSSTKEQLSMKERESVKLKKAQRMQCQDQWASSRFHDKDLLYLQLTV